ncbi:MAG: FMN-binding protein [Oscillospiraceae bacterium]|jgi:electron transport complex protein RnfG|nr:FMN-binding protein [Oscillospiraceae bacterium]
MSKNVKAILLPAVVLTAICIVCAAALGGVKLLTQDKIAEQAAAASNEAMAALFPGASFSDSLPPGTGTKDPDGLTFAALQDGAGIGYAVTSAAKGYGGDIQVMVGFDTALRVTKVIVLDASNETPGLGQNVVKAEWLSQFAGTDTSMAYDEVDAVASATYSSKGIYNAVIAAGEHLAALIGENGGGN